MDDGPPSISYNNIIAYKKPVLVPFCYSASMHHWQDFVLSASLLAFNVALLPSIKGHQKPRLTTSILTATFLVPEIIVFASLSLWYSLTMTALNCGLWTALAIQRYLQLRQK